MIFTAYPLIEQHNQWIKQDNGLGILNAENVLNIKSGLFNSSSSDDDTDCG